MPLTLQVTPVLVELVTVAVTSCELPRSTAVVVGDTVMATAGGGGGGGAVVEAQ